jgi:hypothetical protein
VQEVVGSNPATPIYFLIFLIRYSSVAKFFNLSSLVVLCNLFLYTGVLFGNSEKVGFKMAKRPSNEQISHRPNSTLRVRWVEVELNGSDSSIEEALRTVERMRRPVIEAPASPKRIPSASISAGNDPVTPEDPTLFDNLNQDEANTSADDPAGDSKSNSSETPEAPRRKRGEGDPKDYNAGIKPIGDINFMPPGKQSLRDLFSSKMPSSDMDQVLVICYFLQHVAQTDQIGPGHILSGFKHVIKPVPKDLKKTIRNLKDKKAWLNFSDMENIRLTTEGENRVEHDLGKKDGEAGSA